MKADEIRELTFRQSLIEGNGEQEAFRNAMLREIAAQLAEANELKALEVNELSRIADNIAYVAGK